MRLITFHPPEWPSSESLQSVLERACKTGAPSCRAGNADGQQSLWDPAWRFLENLKTQIRYDPAFPHWAVHPDQTVVGKDTCTQLSLQLFPGAKTQKQPKCPRSYERKKRMWYAYSRECYSAIQKYEIMPFSAAKKDLDMMIVREIIQTEEPNIISYQ